jgi:hypothetical protein
MFNLLRNLFGRRSRGFNPFQRRQSALGRTVGEHRGSMALGTLASIAAPFVIRKLMQRRAQRGYGAAY